MLVCSTQIWFPCCASSPSAWRITLRRHTFELPLSQHSQPLSNLAAVLVYKPLHAQSFLWFQGRETRTGNALATPTVSCSNGFHLLSDPLHLVQGPPSLFDIFLPRSSSRTTTSADVLSSTRQKASRHPTSPLHLPTGVQPASRLHIGAYLPPSSHRRASSSPSAIAHPSVKPAVWLVVDHRLARRVPRRDAHHRCATPHFSHSYFRFSLSSLHNQQQIQFRQDGPKHQRSSALSLSSKAAKPRA